MTTIKHSLDRIEREAGVDVTRQVGRHEAAVERLREARAAVQSEQSLANCREYVAAHEALQVVLHSTLEFAA